MGWFDWFRKPKKVVTLPQICYDVAYFLLPHYAYNLMDKVEDLCRNQPAAAGPFFYAMACHMRKVEAVKEQAEQFRWHLGKLDETRDYFVLEFPSPPNVDLTQLALEKLLDNQTSIVLAPHFCAIVRAPQSGKLQYFVLGQSGHGGGTTLRSVTADKVNANLGPGSKPKLKPFLDLLRGRNKE